MRLRILLPVTLIVILGLGTAVLAQTPTPVPGAGAFCAGGGYLGGCSPIVDTNGNGVPDVNDSRVALVWQATNVVSIQSLWSCGQDDPRGWAVMEYDSAIGAWGHVGLNGVMAGIDPAGLVGGRPTRVMGSDLRGNTGTGVLGDANGDGFYETFEVNVAPPSGAASLLGRTSFVGADTNGDTFPDHVGIPFAQATAFGFDLSGPCAPDAAHSQVWLPMVDTDEDGRPDSIVIGYGAADPAFLPTPRLAIAAAPQAPSEPIPSIGEVGKVLLVATLALYGWWRLRRRSALA